MKISKNLNKEDLDILYHRARKLKKNHGTISPAMIVAKFEVSLHHAYPIAKYLMKD